MIYLYDVWLIQMCFDVLGRIVCQNDAKISQSGNLREIDNFLPIFGGQITWNVLYVMSWYTKKVFELNITQALWYSNSLNFKIQEKLHWTN